MKFLRQITLFSLFFTLFTPLLGMEEKSAIAWFQPKNDEKSIGFNTEILHYSNTLAYLDNGNPSTVNNPFLMAEISENTLTTCKMIFDHLETATIEDKADYLARYFSEEIAELNKEEIRFLDIPLFAKALRRTSNNEMNVISKKRKREDSELQQHATLITSDDHEIQVKEKSLKRAKIFRDMLTDMHDETDSFIPAPFSKESTEFLVRFLNFIQEQEETINETCDQTLAEKIAHLTAKKEGKLRLFTAPIESTYVIDINEGINIKSMKTNAKQQKIKIMPKEQKEEQQKAIEEKFSQKIIEAQEQCEQRKKQTLDDEAKNFIKKQCSSFQEVIALAELGDFTGCPDLFENALDIANDYLTQHNSNYDFSELNTIVRTRLNEKAQAAIKRKKSLNRQQSTTKRHGNNFSATLSRLIDCDIAQFGNNFAIISKTAEIIYSTKAAFKISPDGTIFAQSMDNYQTIQVYNLKTKKSEIIKLNELFIQSDTKICHSVVFNFTTDNSALEIQLTHQDTIHRYLYTFAGNRLRLKKIEEIPLPGGTTEAELLWQFPTGEKLFLEKSGFLENKSYLYFNNELVKIAHESNLLFCFANDHEKILTYSDIDKEFIIRDSKTGSIINSIKYDEQVSYISCDPRGKILAVLTQPDNKNVKITLFNINTGEAISTLDIASQLSYATSEQNVLQRIIKFYIAPNGNHLVIEQSAGLMGIKPTTSIIDINTHKKVLELSDYLSINCLPDGSIMQVKVTPDLVNVSYELFDGQGIKTALRSCSLEESVLIEKIINSTAYVLHDSEKEMYATLPQEIQNIIKSHLA